MVRTDLSGLQPTKKLSSQSGMSIMSSLLMVTIVSLIAATMVAVYSMNLAMTQRTYNGSIAMAEAEAGIAEVLYQITLPENFEDPDGDPTKVTYGRNGETIKSTATPGYTEDEAFHYISFSNGPYPRSTNNCFGDSSSGSLGRTVPNGSLHIVSTGYCKGQYRTVEAVLEKPPFPFGLAASGEIDARGSFVVKGIRTIQDLLDDEETRPGHILCNSSDGITIRDPDPDTPTYISGFVKSVGAIDIAQPAKVLGGIRPFADESSLTTIDVTSFRNAGQPGVVTLLDNTYHQPQEKKIMYFYSGERLTYESSVTLDKGMLYVEGDLLVRGPVSGEGLIVVDGSATFESGGALSGSNKMAVICSGDVTIRGNNNFFTGLVYCGGNFSAANVTVVGNTIINSTNPSLGQAELENVTIVSNEETADMVIPIQSNSGFSDMNNVADVAFPLSLNEHGGTWIFGFPDLGPDPDYGGLAGWRLEPGDQAMYIEELHAALWSEFDGSGDPREIELSPLAPLPTGTAGLWAQAEEAIGPAIRAREVYSDIKNLENELDELDPEDPEYPAKVAQLNSLQAEFEEIKNGVDRLQQITDLVNAVFDFKATHVSGDGLPDFEFSPPDILIDYHFNLNEYLPESEKVKVMFWRVYNRKF